MAVKRNLLKRHGRHIIRDAIKNFKSSYRGVFFFRKGSTELSYEKIKTEIIALLSQAGVL